MCGAEWKSLSNGGLAGCRRRSESDCRALLTLLARGWRWIDRSDVGPDGSGQREAHWMVEDHSVGTDWSDPVGAKHKGLRHAEASPGP